MILLLTQEYHHEQAQQTIISKNLKKMTIMTILTITTIMAIVISGQRACRDLVQAVGVWKILTLLLPPDIQRTNSIRCIGQCRRSFVNLSISFQLLSPKGAPHWSAIRNRYRSAIHTQISSFFSAQSHRGTTVARNWCNITPLQLTQQC